ncbi:sulfate ABC transporter substrate-binding protein [Sinorhizobium sp. 7-81]|uniref:sulfate ABC transporter substrate-binding protein n=1 Tax=Sinorhizobium sp. 8-89 TaxID=3049089 RepID=UPI0024C4066B|nr:sulfate ABC transporter substrate-binding protein [Sinorhizobium sp. 8-89]MDK1494821.1 sulfate ABC transporter substrate-binding protein [Sinorhizobium sp. 8-89]
MGATKLAQVMKLALMLGLLQLGSIGLALADTTILNVSFDSTRKLYKEFNAAFAEKWKGETGETVTIDLSHGGSGKQARLVIDGLEADVVTLALEADVDAIAQATGRIPDDWKRRLENNSAPYTSTVVFLVRKGNPKAIKDWSDLTKEGVQVITPNPKTSGGARWNFLAAWAWARAANNGDEAKAQAYVAQVFKRVVVLDTGAWGAMTNFVQRGFGDVLLAWENEAYLALEELGPDKFEIVTPSISIKAEPPVALIDGNVDRKGTRKVAEAYLDYLYSDVGQKIVAKHYYRPYKPELANPDDVARFADLKLVTIDEFGGWNKAQAKFFADGGIFDQIYKPGR